MPDLAPSESSNGRGGLSKRPHQGGWFATIDWVRASTSRSSGQWSDDDYDVFADGVDVGRIMKVMAAPKDAPWFWSLAYGHDKDRAPTHGYEPTREAAMAPFAKSFRRE
jgi:hypothetical protein